MAIALVSPISEFQNKGGMKLVMMTVTTASASDDVPTGLQCCLGAVATLADTPVAGCTSATALPKDADTTKVTVKTWKPNALADTTPVAATTFTKRVTVFAWGY